MKLINHRFKIIETIITDTFGEIFLVEDILRNRKSRLRLFSVEFSQNDLIKHYQEKFILYSTIVYPNIYQNYKFDIIETIDNKNQNRTQFFYTFEVEKEDGIEYMDLNRQEAIEVLLEICYALKYLHFRGYIYKYLTFDNIHIFRNENNVLKVKLTDLASLQLLRESSKSEKHYNQFIAPEIFWKEIHNIQADIYSLGVVLYYLYHRSSYKTKLVDESLRRSIENAVDKVVAQMIRISVIDEIVSVMEFIDTVGAMFNIDVDLTDYDYYNRLQLKAPILERFEERSIIIDTVKEKFDKVSNKNAMIIVGDMGTGKTRILEEAQTILRWQGHKVIHINCEDKSHDSYDVFKAILKVLINSGDINQELIMKYGSELVKVVPEFQKIWGISPAEPLESNIETLRIKNRLHSFLREYSGTTKLVIILDAIQKLNPVQMDLLEFIMIDQKENQYFIIGSYENDNIISNKVLNWEATNKIIIKNLNNFNYDQASSYVSDILGVAYNPIELTAKVMRDAQGNLKIIKDIMENLFLNEIIYVNSNSEWSLKEQYENFETTPVVKLRSEFISEISDIPESGMRNLELISLFKEAAPIDCIIALINLDPTLLKDSLESLTDKNILKMKFDDLGETYDYCSKSLKRSISEELDKNKKEEFHQKIAVFFESMISQNHFQYTDLIIYHFSNGKHKEKSIKYCIELAEEMERNSMYMQAIELYNRAVGILHIQSMQPKIAEIYYRIGTIYFLIGESEFSSNITYKALNIAKEFEDQIVGIKSMNLLAKLYLKKRDTIKCRQFISAAKAKLEDIRSDDLRYELKSIEVDLYIKEGNLASANDIVIDVLEDIESENEYKAEFLNLRGLIELKEGKLSEALKSFEKSIDIYELLEKKNPIKSLYPKNNIGTLYCLYLDEIQKGRDYFLEILSKLDASNLPKATALFIRNLGESYLIEDQFDKALESFITAQRIVERTMDSFIRADNCNLLCRLYLKDQNYQKASFYLKKLESEYDDYNNNFFVNASFYLVHIQYYVQVKDFDLASQWCERLRKSDLLLEDKEKFNLRLFEYEVEVFRKQYFNYTANIDLKFVEVLVKTQSTIVEAKAVRLLILRLATNLMNYKKYIDVHYLLKLDDELREVFKTNQIEIRHQILMGILEDKRIDYLKDLLVSNENVLPMEDKWLIYKMLGDEYYDVNYYNAISCYFNAFGILRVLVDLLPKENKENYIFCDEVKLDLKSKINNIHRKLVGQNYQEKTVYTELEIRKTDDFFNLTDFKNFVYNNNIKQSISEIYKVKHKVVLNSVSDLIQSFGKNEIKNIELILKYCTQILIGDRGFIFILDEENEIREVVKTDDRHELPDLDRILKSSININEGLLINTIYDNVNSYPFIGKEKGLLCIPIIKNEKENNKRREIDFEENNIEINGYMYIDSKEAFNNFTRKSFDECISLVNILYFFVDNYNLKKISTIDKLTNVYLRSYFEDLFARELQRAKVNDHELSVVMLDIDKFKLINDTYGHRKGDEILTNMCRLIKETIRDTDLIGRYGGEEFILVLPNTNKDNAFIICEKIRLAVMNANFLKDDRRVTISLGIATFPEFGPTEDELIEKADQALYKSKNSGRNRTTIWNPNFGESNKRFDKLAGILEGNVSTDTRNVQAIVDIMNTVKNSNDVKSKIELILNTISDVCEAQKISLIELNRDIIINVSTKNTGSSLIYDELIIDEVLINKYLKLESAEYFINWNDISEIDNNNVPNWKSLIITPLLYNDECKGLLVVSVPIAVKEFDFNTTNFVNAVSGIIASIL